MIYLPQTPPFRPSTASFLMPPLTALVIIACSVVGCGGPTNGRVAVTGVVSLDGQPLESGHVTFQPMGKGNTTAGPVKEGRYKIPADKGPMPGKYRVIIESFVEEQTSSPEFDGPSSKQILPARYNLDSELEAQVAESGKNEFAFELKSE